MTQGKARIKCAKVYRHKKIIQPGNGVFFFQNFPRYHDMQCFMKNLERRFPDIVRIECIGTSYQGRGIDMIVIAENLTSPKRGVLIDAGIHAREWITNTTALFIMQKLTEDQSLLRCMDFYIIPCLNPDGYEFSHTYNRLWRKNLNHNFSDQIGNWGVDLNRNFPCAFGKTGSSCEPNHVMYRGKKPLSEPESQSLSNTMQKYESHLRLYITLHSFGNCILYPWGYTKKPCPDVEILDMCAKLARTSMAVCNQRKYRVGCLGSKMYLGSGNSADYAMYYHHIQFCYTIELQRGGKSGFTPSPQKILEIGAEVLEGVKAMVQFVYGYYNQKQYPQASRIENTKVEKKQFSSTTLQYEKSKNVK